MYLIRSSLFRTALLVLALTSLASAATVIIGPDGGGPNDQIFGISAPTTGSGMIGLLTVTVYFTDGSNSGPLLWAACAGGTFCGQATGLVPGGGVWTLTESGDPGSVTNTNNPDATPINAWTLTNTSTATGIASVGMSGIVSAASGIVFDRDLNSGGAFGTPGSSFGIDYTSKVNSDSGGNSPYTVTVTYNNIVTLLGAAQNCLGVGTTTNVGCGDVWGSLSFAFTSAPFIATTTVTPTKWVFFQDTDLVVSPEPLTFAISGAGLLALLVYRKRRSQLPK